MKRSIRICFFAKDGEVFDFNGKQTIVTGGAYSVDRMYRLIHGYGWWPDEQPSEENQAERGTEIG